MLEGNKSEIARFREQQALEEEAARLGLYGLASGTARHDFIIARMEQGAEHILQLVREGKHQQAHALVESGAWCDVQEALHE
ncbi:MAG: hypothetical protein JO202_20270 [Ktedonobacteraceae bacterium]|nr:hypothetical protein [Ktedonobacteraceae bacterium]